MISVKEARELIYSHCPPKKIILQSLSDAFGCILAHPVFSPIDSPPFHQSAMDGYAFSFDLWNGKDKLIVKGEVQAGTALREHVNQGETARVFTGAAVPDGADVVVMQEKTTTFGEGIVINDDNLKKGDNIRKKGSQSKKGDELLPAGHLLTPASISFLAGSGVDKVYVYAKPIVSIIVTGKELTALGLRLEYGNVYESNSFGLVSALRQMDITPVSVEIADDEINELNNIVARNLHSDVLIITGGVSVGNYDLVPSALENCNVNMIFHKVKQKPGKPFYFGICENTLVFALPGNPAAVLTCFYEYVAPVIGYFTKIEYFKNTFLPLLNNYEKNSGLTTYLKGKLVDGKALILDNQESYKMNSFAEADCLIELEEGKSVFEKDEIVPVLILM